MNIRLYSPFKEIIGSDVLSINITGEVTLKKIVEILVLKNPQFKKFISDEELKDEKISKSFIVVRKNQIVLLNEKISEEDELKIFPTLVGG